MANVTLTLGRGMGNSRPIESGLGSPVSIGWSNANFATALGTEPITLLLELLISTGGGDNWSGSGANYDVYEPGVGLGIPQSRLDIDSFEAVRAQLDWDPAFQWVGKWLKAQDGSALVNNTSNPRDYQIKGMPHQAKQLIDDEICKPLGLCVITGNDGRIKLIRPKNPTKYHVSKANNSLTTSLGTSSLKVGIFNGAELATEAQLELIATAGSGWVVTYDYGTHKFSVKNTASAWSLTGPSLGWRTMGYTSTHASVPQNTVLPSDVATGVFSGLTLTEADMWDVKQVPNRQDQISSVIYHYDYDLASDDFPTQREYLVAEEVNLGTPLGAQTFVIKSKALGSSEFNPILNPISHWKEPATGCDPTRVLPPVKSGVDADSITMLYASMLLDRYKDPPLKFSAKLKWKHNTLEVGDVIQVSYGVKGVLIDRENDAATLSNRIFEIIKLTPNFGSGCLDATFLGHRSATAPSPVVTVV